MAASALVGNCYLCGATLGKTAMKNHLLKVHKDPGGEQECRLMKIEGLYDKNYWLYIDVPSDKPLSAVDGFLRKIWLECCGHLSGFIGEYGEIGKSRKAGAFPAGTKLVHEYDFGSTTATLITFSGTILRKNQKAPVRLLARNVAPQFRCGACGAPADYICPQCSCDSDQPFYCQACGDEHEHEEMLLPVVNSPRMGECGYCGELDVYGFHPSKFPKAR